MPKKRVKTTKTTHYENTSVTFLETPAENEEKRRKWMSNYPT